MITACGVSAQMEQVMTDTAQPTDENSARSALRRLPGIEYLRGLLDGTVPPPPFAATSRIWPAEIEEGRVVFMGEPASDFYNPMGIVHGGWVATLLDTGMACAVHSVLKAGEGFTTLSMNMTFVRPVGESSGRLRCEGLVLHSGGRVAGAEGKVLDASGDLIAYGSETCVVMRVGRGA